MCWNKRKWFSNMSAKMPCKLLSNKKRIMIKKPMPQNSNKIKSTSYSQKQIAKEAKFPLQIFGGLDFILLKSFYPTIIFWYAKMAPIRRKYFIKWGCANSYPASSYRIYQSHHLNGNQTCKLSLNTMTCMPEHGSVNMRSQSLIAITIIW